MTCVRFEERLHRTFAELRAAESRATPSFARMLRRPPRSSRHRAPARRSWAIAAVVMLVAGAAWLGDRPPSPARTERVLAEWRRLEVASWGSPTGFLLETPGRAVLTSVPRFSSAGHWMPSPEDLLNIPLSSSQKSRRNNS